MKKSHLILCGALVALVGGHYALWQKAATNLTKIVDREIMLTQEQLETSVNGTLDVTYHTFGYPLSIGINITKYDIDFQPQKQGKKITAKLEGDINIYTNIFNYNRYSFNATPLKALFTVTEDGVSKDIATVLHIGKLSGNGVVDTTGDSPSVHLNIQDTNLLLNGKKMAHIGSITQDFSQDTTKGISEVGLKIAVEDVTLFHPPQEKNAEDIRVDMFKIAMHANNVDLGAGKILQQEMQASTSMSGATDGKALRKALAFYIENIVTHGTQAFLDELVIKKDGFDLTIKGHVTIDDLKNFDAAASLNLQGLDALKKLGEPFVSALTNPFLQGIINGDSVEINVAARKGFVSFNGIPLMPIPNAEEVLYYIPDKISAQ